MYFVFKKFLPRYEKRYGPLTLCENHIKYKDDSLIPYEYILTMSDNGIRILAKQEEDGKLVPNDSILLLRMKMTLDILNELKYNLFYHLRYNEINLDVLEYKSMYKGFIG
jgi:hypothetical protein